MFDYLELNQCLCLSIIILTCSDSFVDSGPDFHDSDQDPDGNEKSASGRFVVFLESGDSDADSDMESHEMASSALSDNSGELPGSELDSDELGDTFTLHLPKTLIDLRKTLLGDYSLPQSPPREPQQQILTASQKLSLGHYIAWKKSNGT